MANICAGPDRSNYPMAPGLETFPLALAASHEALLRWHGTAGLLGDNGAPTMLFCGGNDSFLKTPGNRLLRWDLRFCQCPIPITTALISRLDRRSVQSLNSCSYTSSKGLNKGTCGATIFGCARRSWSNFPNLAIIGSISIYDDR